MHWAGKYVGLPYEVGARGPDRFDCWGLLQFVYHQEFKIELPDLPGISTASMMQKSKAFHDAIEEEWDPIDHPFDGCGVAIPGREVYHHVGIYIQANGAKILHAWNGSNVIVDDMRRLRLKGIKRIDFYRHRKWPTS